jgi:hypothetical protein
LLCAHPAATAGVQRRDDVLGQERKVLVDQGRIKDQIRAGGQVLKTVGRGRDVDRIARPAGMDAKRASSQRTGFLRRPLKVWDAGWVRRNKEVAPPAEMEGVVAFARKLLHDVDAPIYQSHHAVPGPGPPIPVAFSRLVARQAEGIAFVDQGHVPDALPDGQVVGGADPANARATDHDTTG